MVSKKDPINNFDFIVENMVDGLFTVDANRIITFWNNAAQKILGYKKEEVLGKTCDVLKSSTCMAAIAENSDSKCPLFAKGKVLRKRCIVKAKSGENKYLLKNARILKDSQGNVIGGVENIVDITDQVQTEQEVNLLRKELKGRTSFFKIIGIHYTMQNIYDLLDLAKDSNASVLINGESGTGKELVAQAIHYSSFRSTGPFIQVNCAALAETLLESELFGHVKGAFTDAIRDRKGRFEEAHGGTILLDEIGDLPLSVQIKLLRVIQEKVIERVGDNRARKVDVRIIAATHKDLPALIQKGLFREDLFYRLNVIPIRVPPLRERKTDIPLLIEHFLEKFCRETGKCIVRCDHNTIDILMKYDWPGNVRELENAIEYAFVTCRTDSIQKPNLPTHIVNSRLLTSEAKIERKNKTDEKAQILKALKMSEWKKNEASQLLGYSRVTLWKKMKKYGIEQ